MFGRGKLHRWRTGHKARLRNERGLAMVEYAPILAVIALVLFFAVSYFGGLVSDTLGGGECPGSGDDWGKAWVVNVSNGDKKEAIEEDKKGNRDGVVCIKNPDGGGNGNQGNSQNVKDNDA